MHRNTLAIFAVTLAVSCGVPTHTEERGSEACNAIGNPQQDSRAALAQVVYGSLQLAEQDLKLIADFVTSVEGFPQVPYGRTVQTEAGEIAFDRLGRDIPVIRLKQLPNYILKCENNEADARRRVDGALRAAEVCAEHRLDRLFVPDAALVEIDVAGVPQKFVAVEAFVSFEAGHEAQRQAFENFDAELEQAVEQLTTLVCHTDFRDIRWDNIPLFEDNGHKRIALIDTEPTPERELVDGFVDWGSDGWFMRTPALIGTFPAHAECIVRTAERELSSHTFASLEPMLAPAVAKAKRIRERDASIAAYHRARGITAGSPALDIGQVQGLLTPQQASEQKNLRAALADINAVVARQGEKKQNISRAREWRLTMDMYTEDSHRKENIYSQYHLLSKLLPRMLETGLIHSFLTTEQARKVGVDIRRHHLNASDYIVQF